MPKLIKKTIYNNNNQNSNDNDYDIVCNTNISIDNDIISDNGNGISNDIERINVLLNENDISGTSVTTPISLDIAQEFEMLNENINNLHTVGNMFKTNIKTIHDTHQNISRLWLYYINKKLSSLVNDMRKLNNHISLFEDINDLSDEQLLLLMFLRG